MARYIDAEQVIPQLFSVAITADLYGQGISAGIDQALRIIKEQPTADVEVVRHGYWKHSQSPLGWQDIDVAVCSECGEEWVLEDWDIEEFSEWHKFCPICGADMRGVKDE